MKLVELIVVFPPPLEVTGVSYTIKTVKDGQVVLFPSPLGVTGVSNVYQ